MLEDCDQSEQGEQVLRHRHLLTLSLEVDAKGAAVIGGLANGYRTIVPVVSGRFQGDRLSGIVVKGADWVLSHGSDRMEIDVRLILNTHDGASVYLAYQGTFRGKEGALLELAKGAAIPEDQFSLAIIAKFECGDPRYTWLNDIVAVGTGSQSGFNPTYQIFEIR